MGRVHRTPPGVSGSDELERAALRGRLSSATATWQPRPSVHAQGQVVHARGVVADQVGAPSGSGPRCGCRHGGVDGGRVSLRSRRRDRLVPRGGPERAKLVAMGSQDSTERRRMAEPSQATTTEARYATPAFRPVGHSQRDQHEVAYACPGDRARLNPAQRDGLVVTPRLLVTLAVGDVVDPADGQLADDHRPGDQRAAEPC